MLYPIKWISGAIRIYTNLRCVQSLSDVGSIPNLRSWCIINILVSIKFATVSVMKFQ